MNKKIECILCGKAEGRFFQAHNQYVCVECVHLLVTEKLDGNSIYISSTNIDPNEPINRFGLRNQRAEIKSNPKDIIDNFGLTQVSPLRYWHCKNCHINVPTGETCSVCGRPSTSSR